MSELTIIEILKLIDEADSEKRKIKLLKKNDNFILRTILQGNFSEQIKFDMPKGSPQLEETKEEEIVSLDDEIIKQICKSCDKRQHQWRREIVFTKAIQNLSEEEKDIIIAMKDKTINELYPSITYELVKEAYPKILSIYSY